ncbi:hypothetical protein M405DRAFT_821411 [Rhizopogon salebrosus TDB-379]|nr:hypothetical protein M405DRAFT_821411 [Rhizopogon salebrosus TDB-379]
MIVSPTDPEIFGKSLYPPSSDRAALEDPIPVFRPKRAPKDCPSDPKVSKPRYI